MMAPPTIRRLLRETAELSASAPNPNPTFFAAPVSDSNLHEWHFTLLGPPAPSPYAGGLYHGRISLPSTYPLKPPNFRFLTPSGRFEVNREICLSISGFHEETWMPAWGVRTALTALRSFMVENGTAGQVGGLEASREVREKLARDSRLWRCEACGRRSNEEIMAEWWKDCRGRGVKVEEDMALESLPEGMNLEARDPTAGSKEAGRDPEAIRETAPQAVSTAQILPSTTATEPRFEPERSTDSQKERQAVAEEILQSVPVPESNTNERQADSPATYATTIRTTPVAVRESSNATIDTAIGALIVALCIMILKKIFYPAASPMDDFYLNDG